MIALLQPSQQTRTAMRLIRGNGHGNLSLEYRDYDAPRYTFYYYYTPLEPCGSYGILPSLRTGKTLWGIKPVLLLQLAVCLCAFTVIWINQPVATSCGLFRRSLLRCGLFPSQRSWTYTPFCGPRPDASGGNLWYLHSRSSGDASPMHSRSFLRRNRP